MSSMTYTPSEYEKYLAKEMQASVKRQTNMEDISDLAMFFRTQLGKGINEYIDSKASGQDNTLAL